MQSSSYWGDRFTQLEDSLNSYGLDTFRQIEPTFQRAQRDIQREMESWYARLAVNNQITMQEARKFLSVSELEEFKWDVKEYISHGKANAIDKQWMRQLENASAKYHISRLEALKIRTQQSLEQAFGNELDAVDRMARKVYSEGYYHSIYEVQKGFGLGFDIASIDEKKLEKILSKPWASDGKNFSSRIWQSKTKMLHELHNELTRTCLLGKAPDEAIRHMTKFADGKFKNAKSQAGRLVMTEQAFFASASQKDAFNELDVEEFEIVATLDSLTSKVCQGMDGLHFAMKDFEAGITAPPFHPWCRSCTCPYFDDEFSLGERAARGEDGKTYYLPESVKYEEWKEKFVDGGDKSDFGVYEKDGITHYYKPKVEPEPILEVVKPKKQYLTKKKLQSNIANNDLAIEELHTEFKTAAGYTPDGVLKNFGSLDDFAEGDDLAKLKGMQSKIEQLELEKAGWQIKLDEKLLKEQKKVLTKQKMELGKQIDDFEIETFTGIWKDDFTTADWAAKKSAIQGKKTYFENQFLNAADEDDMNKWKNLIQQVDEFDAKGKAFYALQSQLKKTDLDLTKLSNGGIIKNTKVFSEASKDAALWFDKNNGGFGAADDYFDPSAKDIHNAATKQEHEGFYTYTSGSGGHNRPLAGFEKTWKESGSGWEQKYQKGPKNVWIDYEGKGEQIRGLTTLIEKSTYDRDVWLQSGQNFQTLEGFLHIPYGTLSSMGDLELADFIGTREKFYQFLSTAVNEGGGSMFNGKPMKLNIYAPKNSQMLYASDVGAFGKGENEMILQRGGTYEITNMYWGNDATDGNARKIFVDMEVRPEVGYDTFQQDPNEWAGSKGTYQD